MATERAIRGREIRKHITKLRHAMEAIRELDAADRQYILRWMRDTYCFPDWEAIKSDDWRKDVGGGA